MTRMVVAREGDNNPVNNCIIEPGALYVEDDVLPVVWDAGGHRIIGKASAFERNGNEVTMEIELLEGIYADLENEVQAYVFVQPFEAVPHPLQKGAISRVVHGRVREVNLMDKMGAAYPKEK